MNCVPVRDGVVLEIRLFGKFTATRNGALMRALEHRKVVELLAILLICSERAHSREVLATALWADASAENARAYLRKTLWQLQAVLDSTPDVTRPKTLLVEQDWLQLNPDARLWCDVVEFQRAYRAVQGVDGEHFDED